jgi:three-Cys-motif partner protein
MARIKYDEIGYWSEVKLDIVREYASAYSRIIKAQPKIKQHLYIDAFAGAGRHISKNTGEFVLGSPLNALAVDPPFSEFHLIDLDGDKTDELRQTVGGRDDVHIYSGDANQVLIRDVFPRCRYEDYRRALCLLDPYALTVDWNVIQTAGKMKSIEIFFNFMMMDANMNVFRRNPDKTSSDQSLRMDRAWGDHSWFNAAYERVLTLFGPDEEKASNEAIAEAFRVRLNKVAGFKYVPEPMPMRNKQGALVYYLYFASGNRVGAEIVQSIFKKYCNKGVG